MSNIQSKKFRRQNANVVMTKQRRPTSSTHKFFLALNLHRKSFPQDKLITFLNILNLQMKAKSVFFPKRLHSTEHILICIFFQTRHNRLFWSASKSVYFDCVLLLRMGGGMGPQRLPTCSNGSEVGAVYGRVVRPPGPSVNGLFVSNEFFLLLFSAFMNTIFSL